MSFTGLSHLKKLRITTPSMILRPLSTADFDEFIRIHTLSEERFGPWMPALRPGETYADLFERRLKASRVDEPGCTELRLSALLPGDRLAGIFSLTQVVGGVMLGAYASWYISADVMGAGLGTQGLAALMDTAFAPPPAGAGLHRVQANVIPWNQPSIRIALKNGFRVEGLAPRYMKIGGEWRDHLLMAKLSEEHVFNFHPSGGVNP